LRYPVWGAIDVEWWIPSWLLLRGTAGASFSLQRSDHKGEVFALFTITAAGHPSLGSTVTGKTLQAEPTNSRRSVSSRAREEVLIVRKREKMI